MKYRSVMLRGVLYGLLLMAVSTMAVAEATSPRVAIVATGFVLEDKLDKVVSHLEEEGVEARYHYVENASPNELAEASSWADWVIMDAPRRADATQVREAMADVENETPRLLVSAQGPEALGLTSERSQRLYAYYRNGNPVNFRRMGAYLRSLHQGEGGDGTNPPIERPASAWYHPDLEYGVTDSLAQYPGWEKGRDREQPVVGLLIHESDIANMQTAAIEDLMARIRESGGLPVALYGPMMEGNQELKKRLMTNGKPRVDVLVNFQVMYSDQRRQLHETVGVPVMQVMTWRDGDASDWASDPVGIAPVGVPFYMAMPETTGVIDPLVAVAVEDGRKMPIPRQMESVASRALNMARLQRKPESAKRLALFYYNYPPGENNLAASFLNVPRSLEKVTNELANAGYDLEPLAEQTLIDRGTAMLSPFYRANRLEALLEKDLATTLPLSDYRQWFETLPKGIREQVRDRWGEPEASPMVKEIEGRPQFVIPRLRSGNVTILPQPPRGRPGDTSEGSFYHDGEVPLTHFYMAVYQFVRSGFEADALIHFGTHGTQEWTPGKERGLDVDGYPYLVLGDVPVFYPYIVDNIGEATQAKRRGRATIVSHQTPPFRPAGLDKELDPMHDLIHEYQMLDQGAVRERTRDAIIEEAGANELYKDLGWDPAKASEDFDAFMRELHNYLHQLAQEAQPLGLHSFGKNAEPKHRVSTVMQMLGDPFYDQFALDEPDELFVESSDNLGDSEPLAFLQRHLLEDEPLPDRADPALREQLNKAREYHQALDASPEIKGLLNALDGRFVDPATGGDPIRQPDALPTGRNLHGFDPSKLPTEQAYETGRNAVEQLIEDHRRKNGEYPEKLAFSLWAVEAMRHLGVLEAQAFHAMGVRPEWDRAGRVTGFEIIPREELGRPRVDVVLSATGLYRDQFPNVIGHLADAAAAVAKREEPDNLVRQHALRLRERLMEKGVPREKAWNHAVTRVFTSKTGTYGTGLEGAALDTDSWEDEDRLAELYLERMQYAYGPDRSQWGQKLTEFDLFKEQLRDVDSAVLARSSNLYGMVTTDDPFQYLGGLSLAVRNLTGKSPDLHISNLRDPDNARYESASRFMAKELRTRQFHRQWIKSMKKEGYAGTTELVDSMNNFWGWQVVDPDVVTDGQWQRFHDVYVDDAYDMDMREWFESNNPQALAQMTERMLEAVRKEYWDADEATIESLAETYWELQKDHDVEPSSSELEPWLNDMAVGGYGLQGQAPDETQAASGGTAQPEAVKGQKLTQQKSKSDQMLPVAWLLALPLFLLMLAGGLQQWRHRRITD